ncbi:hypothetical protein BDB01DRAFT_804963 [Pilobolus umbonatus]|nr:hypothetical protein BDB01DRAFT_804963 [Pilobolus umbonatus]
MSGSKRTVNLFDEKSAPKRARIDKHNDIEFDLEEELEQKKSRRGTVNFDVYGSDDEEVGGGVYSSDEEDKPEEEEQEAGDDFDMFSDTKGKAPEKKKVEIEGQEFDSYDRDSDDESKAPKLTAFNMKEEMEEGKLDSEGNYIKNKEDPQAFHDKWMEGISRKDINQAKEAQEKRERQEALKEAERQSTMPQTKNDIYRALVEYLKPGQTVQEALTTMANSLPKKLPAWKQKMLDKKNKNKKGKETAMLSEEEEQNRRKTVETITGLADQMMALGNFDIYEDTFEIMIRHLRREQLVPEDWLPDSAK